MKRTFIDNNKCMRAFFQRLRRNEPDESGAEHFSVLSDDERLENVIMDNLPMAKRTDKDVSTETDNDVTIVTATVNTRPRRLRPKTTLSIVYGMKDFSCIVFLATLSARAIVLHYNTGWHVSRGRGTRHNMEWQVSWSTQQTWVQGRGYKQERTELSFERSF